jgi:hypothetical protein
LVAGWEECVAYSVGQIAPNKEVDLATFFLTAFEIFAFISM